MNRYAEYICGCRYCGNHCMVVERIRTVEVSDEVPYSDGYLGGWQGVQTEVVTCPHCGIVMSWRKNCLSADLLRQAGDLERFRLPPPVWGPPSLYWAGFKQYEEMFHPRSEAAPPGVALPRLAQAPDSAALWALRKRGALARGLLWLDNDRDRSEFFFGGSRPGPRSKEDERRRPLLLRALLEAALFGGDDSEASAMDVAEWYRELGEWKAAAQALDRTFDDPVLAHRAGWLKDLVSGRNATVVSFEPAPEPQVEPEPVPQPEPVPEPEPVEEQLPQEPEKRANKRAEAPDAKSPRALLTTLLEVLGSLPADALTRDHIPRPYGSLLRTMMKAQGWDEDSFAVLVIRGFARAHGWPSDADEAALAHLEAFDVREELLDYLAVALKRATWDKWAFDVPATPPPKGRR